MCRRTVCRTCGKATYAGCGQHVDQVLAGVARADRCACDRNADRGRGLLARLFGRR
ncbi:hypothetical protein [Streptomyces sp. NRRL B-24484]|uniref:hypothetical protein n=1 Tax=Streptomyces sp. NRRL B-24484 TaxID=1463833 RepID=UPI001900930A|nr:hypothetical protein [Streptomyces sp. NRRL B-24484]